MKKPKGKFKFYTGQEKFFTPGEKFKFEEIKKETNLFIKAVGVFLKGLYQVCFKTGEALISLCLKSFHSLKHDIKTTAYFLPKRFKILFKLQFLKTLFLFLLVCLAAWAGIASLHLVAQGISLKDRILKTAFLGNSYLSNAKTSLASQNIDQAQTSFYRAYQTFSSAKSDIAQSGDVLNSLLTLLPQKQAADSLLNSAQEISSAGQDLVTLDAQLKTLNISQSGVVSSSGTTKDSLNSISDTLDKVTTKITNAADQIAQIKPETLPANNREMFVSLNNQLQNAKLALENLNSIFTLSKSLLLGQKTVLLLFENNNELRAGGGFIGTYGAIKLDDGAIKSLKISSIYDLDGQLLDIIKPPQPMLNVGDRWYMRNSNWFADFPLSAKKASDFYEKEAGETPDVVIAITPDLIIDLLKITGSVNLPKYGVTLTPENFIEQTQVTTTLSNDLPTNQPKQILADLFPILLQRLSNLDKLNWPQIILSLQNELTQKQIVIYSRDQDTEAQLDSFGWAGKVESSQRDYLMVATSNLGGTKTDLSVDSQYDLTSNLSKDGSVTNTLKITRTNKFPNLDNTDNLSYLRIFAPLGSKLVDSSGFDFKPLDFPSGLKYSIDDDVLAWEKNSVTDNLTGTRIGQESGKTFFGNWLDIKGGSSRTVSLSYTLPFKIDSVDQYSLFCKNRLAAYLQISPGL